MPRRRHCQLEQRALSGALSDTKHHLASLMVTTRTLRCDALVPEVAAAAALAAEEAAAAAAAVEPPRAAR